MLRKIIIIIVLSITIPFIFSNNTHATLIATSDTLPLRKGDNVLASAVWNWPTAEGFVGLFLGVRVTVNEKSLVDESTEVKYIVPTRDIPDASNPTGWTEIDFDDSIWHKGKYLIGYGSGLPISTQAGSPQQKTLSIYSRVRFKISDPASIENFKLSARYDDGVVIWLNGVEIARSSNFSPTTPHWNSESGGLYGMGYDYESIAWATYRNIIKSAEQSSDDTSLHRLASWLLYQNLELDKALLCAKKATELDPGNLSYRATLGAIYLMVGEEQEALTQFELILYSEPLNQSAWNGVFQIARDRKIDATQFHGFVDRLKKVFWKDTIQRKRLDNALALFDGKVRISSYVEENKWAILQASDGFEDRKLAMDRLTSVDSIAFEYVSPPNFNEKWKKVDDGVLDGYVDIQKIIAPPRQKTTGVFALTRINSPEQIDTILHLRGKFSGIKLWVNYGLLYDLPSLSDIAVPVQLEKGSNRILIKLIGKENLGYSLELFEVVPESLKSLSYISPYSMPKPIMPKQSISINRALSLDGDGDYVEIPHHDSISPGERVTVEAWVKPAALGGRQGLVFKKNDGPEPGATYFEEYFLGLNEGRAEWGLGKSFSTNAFAMSLPLSVNQWVHLAGTYDGTELRLYVNGVLQATTPWAFGIENSTNPLTLGRLYGGVAGYMENYFTGELDKVRIWNIARTQEEIQATMNTTLQGNEPGLVGYWNFDDSTANDLSPNRNEGTLHGNATIVESDLKLALPRAIDTVDGFRAVPVNQKGQFVLTTGITFIKPIKTIEIRLPKEFSAPGARVMSDVMLSKAKSSAKGLEERRIKASSTQVGFALRIQLEEGITETGMLKVNFEATAGSTTAPNVTFFVKLLAEDGTVIRESQEGLGGIAVISDAPLPVPRDVVAKTIAGENDVEISWKALDDARIAGYEVLATWNEKDAPKVTKQEVMEVKGREMTTYQHISAPPDIEISYAVRAVATSSLKSELSQSAITRVGRDKTPPEIMAIKARRIVSLETGDSGTRIEWNIKGAQDIVQYEIFRSSSPVAKGFNPKKMQKIADVSGEVREYIDKIPRAYIYAVVAIDDGGNRGQFLTFPSMPDDKSIESISIILGDKNISDGIRMPNAGDGQHEPATVAGRLCRKLRANSRYFYFDIDDEYVKDSPHDIYVTVEYFDEGTDSFRIEYNGEITPYTYRQNTGKWNQTTFHLSNPQFRNVQDYLCDFRIVCDSQLAIAKVTVTKNYPLQKFLRAVSYAMIGPLDVTSPESEIDLNKVYTVREAIPSIGDKPVKWFESFPYAEYQAVSQNIDMSEMDGTASEGNFYYALTYVKSPGDMLVKLSKYNIADLWINNIPAYEIAQLKKGSNKILLKITSTMSQFRITNLKGDAIKSIRYMSPYDVLKDGKEPKAGVVKGIMPPQDVHVASLPTGTVELSWSPPPSGENPVKGYEIYQVRESGEIKSIARLPKEMTKWESRKWKPWKTMWKFGLRWKHPSLWFGRESFPNIQQKFLVKTIGSSGAESFSPIHQAPFISYRFWTRFSQTVIDKSGNLWWGIDDGLWTFDKVKKEWNKVTENELSDARVYALASDAGGHTWVGSFGLYKFDGNEWTKVLAGSEIYDVEIDSEGNPWVLCEGQGWDWNGAGGVTHECWYYMGKIKRFVNGKWIEIPSPSNQPGEDQFINPHAFVLDSNNRLWVGTRVGNIYLYNGTDWKTYGSAPQDIQLYEIKALAPDNNKNGVWVIFEGTNGIFFYDGRKWEKHLPDKQPRSIVIDSHGDVWTEDMKYDGTTWKSIDGGDRVILDPYGNPWFMTDMNIKKYDGTESFDFPDMMSSFPTCIDVNEQNQLWLGGGREVAVHDGVKVKVYREKDGILGDVTGLVVGKDNTVWVSTKAGVNAFDGEKWVSYKESDGLSSDNVSAITLDKSGVPWIVMSEHEEKTGEKKGKGEAGIATLLPALRSTRQAGEKGNWKSYKIAKGFESSKFTSICVDKDDNVWVGTQDRGLLRFDGKDWTEYNINNGLTSNKIFKILSDSKRNVYVLMDRDISALPLEARTGTSTTSTGRPESILDIVILEGDSWRKLDVPWGNRERFWRESAIIDKEDNLWVGLTVDPGYGLYKFDGVTWKTFRPDSSWPSTWICELAVDKDNNLWTAYEYIGTVTLRESPIQYPSRARILLLILPVLAIGTGGALSYRQWKHSQGYIAKVIYYSDIVPSPQKLYITVYSLLKSFQEARMFVLLANQASSDDKEDIAKRIRVFSMLIDYLANLGDALREASEAFADKSEEYEWGEEIHSQYQLLLTAYNVKTASQMAAIANNLQKEVENLKQIDDYMLKDSVEAFDMLSKVAEAMRKYERVGLPEDQVVYLNSGITQLEQMQRFIQEQLPMPDKRIFEEITANWRNIIGNALTVLQSSARLRFELKTKELARIEESVLLLGLENVGRGHAENVKVKLLPSEGYELIDEQKEVSTILQRRKVEVEFRIRLNLNELSKDEVPQLRASFEIRYDDAQQEGKLEKYADIFSLQMVAEREFRELMPNPYIAGPPLKDSATFFGREDVFEFIRQTLQGEGQRNIIILYGQRRTGKTSIMYQLKHRLGDDFLPVLIDLQGIGYEGMDSLLYAMALNIYRALRERGIEIERPKFEDFSVQPTVRFRYDFLEAVLEKLQGRFLILMIDEFELLEERVKEGVLDRNIFDYLRNLMQHTEGLGFIFSGSRAIETMASDYWSVLFNIALYREISFLKPQEVERLIREPVREYFDYDPLAVEKIIRTTQGHPYFTQLFCNILVNYRNERRKNYITIQDVNAVIDEVVQTGRVHLEYLWEESSEEEQLLLILLSMALQREGLVTLSTLRELVSDFNLKIDLLNAAEKLSRRHIIEQEAGRYRFSLELVHHWIRQHKNIQEFLETKGGEVNGNNAKF